MGVFKVSKHYGDPVVRVNIHGTDSDTGVNLPKSTAGAVGLAVLEDGRYIVKSGTIYPSNDDKAIGVIEGDYDVTDGDVNARLIRHGIVAVASLPVAPSNDAKAALKAITFTSSDELG